jgi:hypothetical protein
VVGLRRWLQDRARTENDFEAPRYLLPARKSIAVAGAPLYDQFQRADEGRQTGKDAGLNTALREMGKKLDAQLPAN